tara:strand:- start:246 stop:506 length:261 start_codon:yes stop_codon:yes gene_type:complete
MTWNYYNDKEIKKSESFSMFMRVSVILEKDGEEIDITQTKMSERTLHGIVEDILRQAIGEKYSDEVEDEDEEILIEVTIDDISENR